MSDNRPALADRAEPNKPIAGLRGPVLFILSVIATIAGCNASRGNGAPPAFYGLAGSVVLPLAAVGLSQPFRRRRAVQLGVILLGGLAAFVAAYKTSHRPPDEVFPAIFGFLPPHDVHDLSGRVHWYDGEIHLATFVADDTAFRAIVARAGLRPDGTPSLDRPTPDDIASTWQRVVGQWGSMADNFWQYQKQLSAIEAYNSNTNPETTGITQLVRDPGSGEVWAVHLSP